MNTDGDLWNLMYKPKIECDEKKKRNFLKFSSNHFFRLRHEQQLNQWAKIDFPSTAHIWCPLAESMIANLLTKCQNDHSSQDSNR